MTKPEGWIEATAVVTECRFQFARINTFSLGIQRGEKFRISFQYHAQGLLLSGDFQSPTAIPQGEHIHLAYNPVDPKQNTRAGNLSTGSLPLIAIGISGSILLSLLWFALMRGCA